MTESSQPRPRRNRRATLPTSAPKVGLALAGGGPFGAIYEIGALIALDDALDGVDFNDLHVYVGVSAGSFLAAALANQIPPRDIYQLFIYDGDVEGSLAPETFLRPAFSEYWQRGKALPKLLATSLYKYLRDPFGRGAMASFAALSAAIPTGVFDNDAIDRYLRRVFSGEGRSNDFRSLHRQLLCIATDLDSGASVSFGSAGNDHVPISRAVQASAALPGLFPPVEIEGRHFVDGALKRTLHASEAINAGAELVIGINPIVPFDADRASQRMVKRPRLIEGGLPIVLSQTFRALIHSRMAVGLERYKQQYPHADVVVFEPSADDHELFYTNVFSYADRNRVCEYAYQRTRQELFRRRHSLGPILERHGVRLNVEAIRDPNRRLDVSLSHRTLYGDKRDRLRASTAELRETLATLAGWVGKSDGKEPV
jgi:NTE family protein